MAKCTAIVLSAGSGKRMNTDTKKQYLLINDKPVLYYSLKAFQQSPLINEVVLVASADDIEFVRADIVEKYGFNKVADVVAGGKERYNSVYNGLTACGADTDYVFIHDGARPFVTGKIISRAYETLAECGSAVAGMPVKDTIKIVDCDNNVASTPDRSSVWLVQTPQCFKYEIAMSAYEALIAAEESGELKASGLNVTDDAMVVETFYKAGGVGDAGGVSDGECSLAGGVGSGYKVRLFEASYENIKITTPEDLIIAESLLDKSSSEPAE